MANKRKIKWAIVAFDRSRRSVAVFFGANPDSPFLLPIECVSVYFGDIPGLTARQS